GGPMPLKSLSFDEITIEDEGSFAHVALYGQLKRALQRARHRFLVPAERTLVSWDRSLLLNLTFWSGGEGADVLCEGSMAADVVREPERAFEDLRALLFDVSMALLACRDASEAQVALERWGDHRFEPLLHHYQLSNWILYARAYAAPSPTHDAAVAELHAA